MLRITSDEEGHIVVLALDYGDKVQNKNSVIVFTTIPYCYFLPTNGNIRLMCNLKILSKFSFCTVYLQYSMYQYVVCTTYHSVLSTHCIFKHTVHTYAYSTLKAYVFQPMTRHYYSFCCIVKNIVALSIVINYTIIN